VYVPNTSFLIGDGTTGQAALSITGGYRGRLPLPGKGQSGNGRDGVYVGAIITTCMVFTMTLPIFRCSLIRTPRAW
jgi:hypothetical protein